MSTGSEGRARILVVDDDPDVRELLSMALSSEGFDLVSASEGPTAIQVVEDGIVQLVLLDIMMPGMDGIQVCRTIRQRSGIPIIMLTARRNEADIVQGLEAGADDYITKPFSVRELAARVRSTLRRQELDTVRQNRGPARQSFDAGQLVIDGAKQQIEVGGAAIPLSRTEFALLQFLVSNEGRVVPHDEITEQLWKTTGTAEQSRLRTFMGLLRKKLGEHGRNGRYLHSHHGSGYRFEVISRTRD